MGCNFFLGLLSCFQSNVSRGGAKFVVSPSRSRRHSWIRALNLFFIFFARWNKFFFPTLSIFQMPMKFEHVTSTILGLPITIAHRLSASNILMWDIHSKWARPNLVWKPLKLEWWSIFYLFMNGMEWKSNWIWTPSWKFPFGFILDLNNVN